MIKIIMCTYNGAAYIEEQLESIKDNSIKGWELYISDDHSTDCTLKIVREFQSKISQPIHIIDNNERQGAALNFLNMARYVGNTMSEDEYIMFCDQDDVWDRDKIEVTCKEMDRLVHEYGKNIPLLVCSDVRVVSEKLELISSSFHRMNHYNINKMDFSHLMMENKVQGCTTMINKALVDMMDQLPVNVIMHDGWCGFIASVFGKISYIDKTTMMYRQHTNNFSGSVDFWDDIKGKLGKLSEQKQIVFHTTGQIGEFIEIYKKKLDAYSLTMAEAFATLEKQGFWMKRYNIIKYRMWKSGVLRNIGLMLLI